MIDRLDRELNFAQKAINLRAYRQELLASNIANADTPHFKARDLDFKAALEGALAGRSDGALPLVRTAAGHLPGAEGDRFGSALKYRAEYQGAVDGNTVNMDVERSAFAENSVHMEMLLTLVNSKFRSMNAALQGQ